MVTRHRAPPRRTMWTCRPRAIWPDRFDVLGIVQMREVKA
jgi:hypothetical protein